MRSKDSELQFAALVGAGTFLLLTGVIVASYILNGFVLSLMWEWLIVPKFGLPSISASEGIFISLIVGFLTFQHIDTTSPERSVWGKAALLISVALFRPLLTLLIAYIILQFLPAY